MTTRELHQYFHNNGFYISQKKFKEPFEFSEMRELPILYKVRDCFIDEYIHFTFRLKDLLMDAEREVLDQLSLYKDKQGKVHACYRMIDKLSEEYKDINWEPLLSKENFHNELLMKTKFESLIYNLFSLNDQEIEEWDENSEYIQEAKPYSSEVFGGNFRDQLLSIIDEDWRSFKDLVYIVMKLAVINSEVNNNTSSTETEKKSKKTNKDRFSRNQRVLLLDRLGFIANNENKSNVDLANIISKLTDLNEDNIKDSLKSLDKSSTELTRQEKLDIKRVDTFLNSLNT